MRILIYGAGKTGTTAVYYAFKNLLPNHIAFFEPPSLLQLPYDQHSDMLVKSLSVLRHDKMASSFERYQQKILIVRHPFDRLVSYILFAPNNGPGFLDDRNMERYLDLLRRKLESPRSVSMREITAMVEEYYPSRAAMHDSVTVLETIARTYPDFFLLRYEDFVDGRLDALSAYCGLPLSNEPEITGFATKVARSKSHGDWHKWFLPEDVTLFREIYGSYLERFGYETQIEEAEPLDLDTTINYSIKVGNQGRQNRWLPIYVPGEVHMTWEGPAYHAARNAFQRGSKDEALRMIDEVIAGGTAIAGFFELKSQILAQAEDFAGAAEALRQAMALAPGEESFEKRLKGLLSKEKSSARRVPPPASARGTGTAAGSGAAPAVAPAGQPAARPAGTAVHRTLMLGQSHMQGIQKGATMLRTAGRFPANLALEFIQLRAARFNPYFPDGGDTLNEALLREIDAHLAATDLVVSVIGGNAYNVLGLVNHERPFDFELSTDPDLPLAEDREILPEEVVRASLDRQNANALRLLGALKARIGRPFVHVQSPPPIPSEAHIRAHPGKFADKIAQFGVTPAIIRYKLWKLQSEIFRAFCAANGIAFLDVPADVVDERGMLVEAAWSNDPTHGNAWYGEQVIGQLSGWLASQNGRYAGAD